MTNKNSFVIIEPLSYYIKNYTFRIKNVTSPLFYTFYL